MGGPPHNLIFLQELHATGSHRDKWVDDQTQQATTKIRTIDRMGPTIRPNYLPLMWEVEDIPGL